MTGNLQSDLHKSWSDRGALIYSPFGCASRKPFAGSFRGESLNTSAPSRGKGGEEGGCLILRARDETVAGGDQR